MPVKRIPKQDSFFLTHHFGKFQLPDNAIAALYPIEDNYVLEDNNLRSPKSLVDLCVDTLCRSLPFLEGELPPGVPQDVVDAITQSLMKHSALNAKALRALKNCEMDSLTLAGCRGVTDEWLEPFGGSNSTESPLLSHLSSNSEDDAAAMHSMDLDDIKSAHETAFGAAGAPPESLTVDRYDGNGSNSSTSTSSFVSASSTPFEHPSEARITLDQAPMTPMTPNSMSSLPVEDFVMHNTSSPYPARPLPTMSSNLVLLDLRGSQNLTDRGLMQLRDLGALEVAKLDHCHSLVGRGLIVLANSHRLHTVSLANCRRLTDEAVINISHLIGLESLSVDGCRCLTDRSLAAISDLCYLRRLDLSQCDLLTDQGLEHLEDLDVLEELSLGWCRLITDRGLDTLTNQPGRSTVLKVLRLARCPISDDGASCLGRLRELQELDLNGCSNIGSIALGETLGRLMNLTALDVSYCPGIL